MNEEKFKRIAGGEVILSSKGRAWHLRGARHIRPRRVDGKWLVKYRGEEHDLKALVERLFGGELPDDWSPSENGDPPERRRLRRGPVRCLETGVVYPSQSAAAEALFLSPSMVSKTLRGVYKNPTYHFEYASADDLPVEGEAATEAA